MDPRTFASAMVLVAHPDDAEFMAGGTIASWARSGCEVHEVVITDGSAGSNEPGATREQLRTLRAREQREAAAVLGVTSVTFLGELDGMLEVTLDTRRKVCREVRRLRPEVLVAPDPSRLWSERRSVNHWDHKQAGVLALTAVMPDAPSRPMFPELLEEGFEPFEVPNLYLVSDEADVYVDITEVMDTKLAAIAAHASQVGSDTEGWVRERSSAVAARAGNGAIYAEGFKAFRFVDDEG